MSHKVVTNLRIDEVDWLQVKTLAAELGMSVNQYINAIIKKVSVRTELSLEKKTPKKTYSIWNLSELAKIKDRPMELSEEDRIIYGQ